MSTSRTQHRQGEAGFSLIELLIVCAMVAIIATVAIWNTTRARQLAHEKLVVGKLAELIQIEGQYRVALGNGSKYATLDELRAAQTANGPLMPANLAPVDDEGQPAVSNGWIIRDLEDQAAPAIDTVNSGGWAWAASTRPGFAITAVPQTNLKATYQYCAFEDGTIRRALLNQSCTRTSELATDQ